jgi:hypothetical protein
MGMATGEAKTPDDAITSTVPDAPSYTSILEEHDVARTQRDARIRLLKEMKKAEYHAGRDPNGVIAHISRDSLMAADIPILGNVLLKIGDVHTLDLILHSPGGDGTVVEKFVSLCRAQCKRFRVIPNEAKSAATMIALGADEILMGPPSDLGPIDAQVDVLVGGTRKYLSAQSFIDARDKLLNTHREQVEKNENTAATLQQIATLDLPFIAECERMMDFSREVVKKFLLEYMFHKMADKKARAEKVVKTLSSVERFKVHGRFINGNTARRELGLKVILSGNDDEFWKKVWEYYTRAEVALSQSRSSKLFETTQELLMAFRG